MIKVTLIFVASIYGFCLSLHKLQAQKISTPRSSLLDLNYPKNLTTFAGANVTFECFERTAESQAVMKFDWLYSINISSRIYFLKDGDMRIHLDPKDAKHQQLSIVNVSTLHSGWYTCLAQLVDGSKQIEMSSAYLKVLEEKPQSDTPSSSVQPASLGSGGAVKVSHHKVEVNLGDDVMLPCGLSFSDSTILNWYFQKDKSSKIEHIFGLPNVVAKMQGLAVTNVSSVHQGYYLCSADSQNTGINQQTISTYLAVINPNSTAAIRTNSNSVNSTSLTFKKLFSNLSFLVVFFIVGVTLMLNVALLCFCTILEKTETHTSRSPSLTGIFSPKSTSADSVSTKSSLSVVRTSCRVKSPYYARVPTHDFEKKTKICYDV